MKKIIPIVLFISVLVFSCNKTETTSNQQGTSNTTTSSEAGTMDIDFQAVFGEKANDDNNLMQNSYLKVSGSYGNIDAKVDATTGASTPKGATKSWDSYRYENNQYANNKIERGLGFFVLYGVSPSKTYNFDGMTGTGTSQKVLNGTNGPIITGTGVTKDETGVITIRYAHAGGPTVYPWVYELKSDTNGIFKIGYGSDNNKVSTSQISNDMNFADIQMATDKAKDGIPYWQGDLQGTFENDTLTLKGTLKEVK
ncbi:hypothetical protein OFR22_10745 [Brachyspira hyodysenteriae]|uniref:Lipoprotein n=2 Tax=Brachyspira hyodysenteriae TaxID=159 RepID=A0A3B6V980_BRAHW|nr:hypothetical protein [Brachyspira hyodysenteriae]ACN83745.1 hypothetical protein BHWA1_01266 [Brachyspira hyodysenteriae WA1]ANN64134.1 hypothetical protein BHYOB78_09720 [Brachyspira hyodysenteriae ATCC 27164]AUJ49479.1 hypothetical protein BH718_01032 [Brachyspira hyodysenteriae]KLI22399.1 hypothetical protein SU43_08805 [Brachyspira hyodysenteriae]KLI27134.1 hypothetical protein SR30_03460 [Brachyspira hyodysenteriae]